MCHSVICDQPGTQRDIAQQESDKQGALCSPHSYHRLLRHLLLENPMACSSPMPSLGSSWVTHNSYVVPKKKPGPHCSLPHLGLCYMEPC